MTTSPRDSFDETSKNLMRLILGRVFHSLSSRDAGLNVATLVSEQSVCFAAPAVSTISIAARYALVFLCNPLAHLPLASERSARIENSGITIV
jgi:hypothetical protein